MATGYSLNLSLKQKITLSLLSGFTILLIIGWHAYISTSSLIKYTQDKNNPENSSAIENGERTKLVIPAGIAGALGLILIAIFFINREIKYSECAEDDLKKAYRLLEESNKELSAFSYSVSHDLRAPLRHIIGFSEKLNKRIYDDIDDNSRRYLRIVIDSTGKMGKLIDELLTYSKIGKKDLIKKEIDMSALIKEIIQEMEDDFEMSSQIDKVKWIICDTPVVFGDISGIRIVLTNLIANAVKYSSKISFPNIEINGIADENEIQYCIKDNGVGFDMKYAQNLFGVFQRLHREEDFQGTGIGLATVRRIISKHEGRTWAVAELNKGAEFYFTLPNQKNN